MGKLFIKDKKTNGKRTSETATIRSKLLELD